MKKNIENLEFDNIDISKYQSQIDEIQDIYNSLKKNKHFMRKFNNFLKEENKKKYYITYNQLTIKKEHFVKTKSSISISKNKKKDNDCYESSGLSLFS